MAPRIQLRKSAALGHRCRRFGSNLARGKNCPVWIIRGSTALALSTTATVRPPAAVVVLAAIGVVVLATRLAIPVAGMRASGERLRRIGDGTRNVLGRIVDVELFVDVLGNGLDLSAELLFDLVQVESILPVDKVDGETKVSETPRTTNAVQVGLRILGEVEVDDDVDRLNIDTASQQVRADEVTADAVAEIVEDPVAVLLKHSRVRVETGIAQFRNLLGQKFHSIGRVAENDGLVDLQFGEQRIQTVNLLLLLDEGIVLRDTTQRKFIHEIDLVRIAHVLVL